MPYIKIWIHIVWATKGRKPYLAEEIRNKVFLHIKENAKAKGIYLDHINGYVEHVHCLISLNSDQNIATIANLLKGESSFWINKNKLSKEKFGWQDEYFAASVSHSQINMVRQYIRNQEEHHQKKTFQQEYDEFISKYGFEKGFSPLKNRVVQISSINSGGSIYTDELLTSKNIFTEDQQLFQDDILVVITGVTIGKIAYWNLEEECYLGGDIVKFQTNNKADPYFVFNYLLSKPAQIQITRNITGATNGHLAPGDIKNILIPIPPLEKQNEIADHIRQLRDKADRLQHEADKELEKASRKIEELILKN